MPFLLNGWTQWFPPAPTLTEQNLPSQAGKVFIVTGGNQGIGYELIKILYSKGATIYMASRSQEKAEAAIATIKSNYPESAGRVKFLHLDLNDLTTIQTSATAFAAQETRLDVLWNNAGVAGVPVGMVTAQNFEQHLGVNCMAPHLFTQLLLPQLRTAAQLSPPGSVRIVWTSSWMAEGQGPPNGMTFTHLHTPANLNDSRKNYGLSKAGNWLLAAEGAKRYQADGIVSVVQNPGNLATNIWRALPRFTRVFITPILYKTVFGAYTELFAGLSEEVRNGEYVIPWGRIRQTSERRDIVEALKLEQEGGMDIGRKFWEWCEENTKQYA